MPMKKCPKCSNWYHVPHYAQDHVHTCRKSSGERWKKWNVPGRTTVRLDDENWNLLGINPHMPDRKMTRNQLRKKTKKKTKWNQYIEYE